MVHLLGVVSLLLSSQLAFVAADEARFHKTKTNAVLLKLLARDSSHEARYDKDCSYGYHECHSYPGSCAQNGYHCCDAYYSCAKDYACCDGGCCDKDYHCCTDYYGGCCAEGYKCTKGKDTCTKDY